MRSSFWMTAVVVISLAASAAFAARGVIVSKNGQTFDGEITEEPNHYVIMRRGITTRIAREDVASLRFTGPVDEEIKKAWDKLSRDDVSGRIALSRKAFQNSKYDIARALAEQALAIEPNCREAVDLLDLIRKQVLMESRTAEQSKTRGGGIPEFVQPVVLMDNDDINAIRQAELQTADSSRVRVRFNNEVRKRYTSMPGVNANGFSQLTAYQQAVSIIRNGSEEMLPDVIIMDDPIAIRGFKNIQKSILAGCASIICHGSMTAGNFMLYPNPDNDGLTYANFHLLMKYSKASDTKDTGIFGGSGARLRMIDRERPAQSLLLQYSLPTNMADHPHPSVPLFKPITTARNDVVYGRLFDWISGSLRPVDVVYSVKYVSPIEALVKPSPATKAAPATIPATKPIKPATRPVILMPSPPKK